MRIIIIFILVVLFSSCHRLHDGKITDKYIVPEHAYSYITYIYTGKTMIPISHVGIRQTEYIIRVTNKIDGEIITEKFSVDESYYQCKSIGDYFNDTIPCKNITNEQR